MLSADVIVIGGSLGGTLAAYRAAGQGKTVILTEETDWLGGQLTSQAVPPDEHRYIETTGCTASYRAYRNRVREHYRSHPDIIEELKTKEVFCPGGSSVSRLAHPPKLALRLLDEMLKPLIEAGTLRVLYRTRPVSCRTSGDEIAGVTVRGADGRERELTGKIYLDATDTGELLPLCGAEYATGAEARAETGEELAPERADPEDMQPATWVAACDWQDGRDCPIDKPALYDEFRALRTPYDDYPVLGMYGPDAATGRAKRFGMFPGESRDGRALFPLFPYRRIVAAHHFRPGAGVRDVTLINWPQNDYFLDNIFGTADDAARREGARQLTLSLIYWLQTEGGYRGLGLARDVLGTADGLAQAPYVRESRRIRALFTVTAEMLADRGDSSPVVFADSVGVGMYHIDLHITTRSHTFLFREARPFTVPLGCMIPVRIKNLLPACKNTGTTHLAGGCFRLHPVEWNVGEVAGLLASFCIDERIAPVEAARRPESFARLRALLHAAGVETEWRL